MFTLGGPFKDKVTFDITDRVSKYKYSCPIQSFMGYMEYEKYGTLSIYFHFGIKV